MLISVTDATQIILERAIPFADEWVALEQALDRVLAEDLLADRDFPPFDRVAMDGIAIRYEDFANGMDNFPIQAIQAAGQAPLRLEAGNAMEIMTGAMLSEGADTVIRYEDIIVEDGQAKLQINEITAGQNVHRQGKDRKQGEVVVAAGRRLSAAEIGIAATVGKTQIKVKQVPQIAIVSTGDELVAVGEQPLPYQIRRSNAYQLSALMKSKGFDSQLFHLKDDPAAMKESLAELLAKCQLVILTGGVSKGKFDYLPSVLAELGLEKALHRVAQKPGKPLWFGTHSGGVVFGLPGNPVSSFVCTLRYVLPWLNQSLGQSPLVPEFVELDQEFSFSPPLTYFLPVMVKSNKDGRLVAQLREEGGSGNLAKLSRANGVLELPPEPASFKAGAIYPFWRFR